MHATENYRRIVELVQSASPATEVHVWVEASGDTRPGTRKYGDRGSRGGRRRRDAPPHLNWDLWIGPRRASRLDPLAQWYRWWNFGSGT
jgi:hypothetical protein